jgi:hypothetical protein
VVVVVVVVVYVYVCMHTPLLYTLRVKINNLAKRGQGGANILRVVLWRNVYIGAMTTTTATNGRLCNQIIRNLAVSLLAEKHDLYVDYASCGTIRSLGIKLCANRYGETKVLTDANYFEVYDCDAVNFNLDPNDAYFQSKTITNTLYDYLRCNTMKEGIISSNPFKSRYSCNTDLGIHIRLTDVARFNPVLIII